MNVKKLVFFNNHINLDKESSFYVDYFEKYTVYLSKKTFNYFTKDVRKYLREFLSDTRVIEVPKIIWWLVLNLFILPLRPRKSAALYKSVWLEEGSPLLVYSKRFLSKIKNLNENSESIEFELAMRYGNPVLKKPY